MSNVYIAGSCVNKKVIKSLMGEIESWGHRIVIDWTKHIKGDAKDYALEDITCIKGCDCLVYCMDGIKSRGKNFELGYASALEKPIAIYNTITGETAGHDTSIDHLINNECVFIRGKLYKIINSRNELRTWLSNG